MTRSFTEHRGILSALIADNVDTDQIIPSREMKQVDRKGLAEGLFAAWRYAEPGSRAPNPDFILNQPSQAGTSILVSGWNFGCGSSREHAVWALVEFGVRCIIAKSFGEIFQGNCFRNGILPITLGPEDVEQLFNLPAGAELVIDLPAQSIRILTEDRPAMTFEIRAAQKELLVSGLDMIEQTSLRAREIDQSIARDERRRPWLY